MAELLFYHLERSTLDAVLPQLLEKTLARGWKAVVRAGSDERVQALDAHLWTYRDDAFLPHGIEGGQHDCDQPVVLTGPVDPSLIATDPGETKTGRLTKPFRMRSTSPNRRS